ncbi:MAG TPA: glycosyltransferase family 9 protein [Planktothrix sp.]
MAVYIAAFGAGLGDLAVLLPLFQSLIAQGERVIGVARSRMQEELLASLPGLTAIVQESELASNSLATTERYLDFAAHPTMRMAEVDWLRFKAIYPNTQINDFIRMICAEVNLSCDTEHLKPLPSRVDARTAGKVLFIPGTTSNSKTWPMRYWLEVAQAIGSENVLLIGKTDSLAVGQLVEAGFDLVPTPTIADAIAALSSARAIVSVDTGLMHLAVHQGVPTVSFCNHASFWRRFHANLDQLVTSPCTQECIEHGLKVDIEESQRPRVFHQGNVHSQEHFNFCRVSESERCISSITPQQVVEISRRRGLVQSSLGRQFFAPIGGGLGDVIVSLPILYSLISRKVPTYLIANSERQLGLDALVPNLAATITRPQFEEMEKRADDLIFDFRSHPIQTDHIWGSDAFNKEFPDIRINEILSRACVDFGIDADLGEMPRIPVQAKLPKVADTVLIPGTVTNAKSWPLDKWIQLYDRLKGGSERLLLIGQPERNNITAQLIERGIPWVETEHIVDAISIISSARLVISVDTGLAHIAVNQGIRTIVLYEQNPIYYRPAKNCFPLFAPACAEECQRRVEEFPGRRAQSENWGWYQGDFQWCKMPEAQRCISSISVEDVLNQALQPIISSE